MTALSDRIARHAVASTVEAMKAGAFDADIQRVIVQSIREGEDEHLTRLGFILKMAIELMDRARPSVGFQEAQRLANDAYHEFRRDNRVKFGDTGWDWSGRGARTLAFEYVISYWESSP